MSTLLETKELYRMFLDSDFWAELAGRKKEAVGKCERCGRTGRLQAHHKIYRESWFDTRMEDLECLCDGCHRKAHGIRKKAEPKKKAKRVGRKTGKGGEDDFYALRRKRRITRRQFLRMKQIANGEGHSLEAYLNKHRGPVVRPKALAREGNFVRYSDGNLVYQPRL